jgi:hypothetical protein
MQSQQNSLGWILLIGIITGPLAFFVSYQLLNSPSDMTPGMAIFGLIFLIAGVITGRIASKKWAGALIGAIAAITMMISFCIFNC